MRVPDCRYAVQASDAPLWSVDFDPDNHLLAAASNDSSIYLWDSCNGHFITRLSEHKGPIWAVCFSPDGSLLASGGFDRQLILWDTSDWTVREQIPIESPLYDMKFSLDGQFIALATRHSYLKIWRIKERLLDLLFKRIKGPLYSVVFDSTGLNISAAGTSREVYRGSLNRPDSPVKSLSGHNHAIWSLASLNPLSKIAAGTSNGTVIIWNPDHPNQPDTLKEHTQTVWSLTSHPFLNLLASGGGDRSVTIWDTQNFNCLSRIADFLSDVLCVTFSMNGQLLAACDKTGRIRVFDFPSHLH